MSEDQYQRQDRLIREQAESVDIIERLRGQAFMPGVDYVKQAQAWMHEAADLIERLREQSESPSPFTELFRSDGEGSVVTVEALQAQLAYLEAKMGKLAETVHRHDVQLARTVRWSSTQAQEHEGG